MKHQDITAAFQDVDRSDADFLIQFLVDANRIPSVVESFQTQLKMLEIRPGDRVLDIGCGIGERAAQMAEFVGADGKVVGTDLSSLMVEASESRYGNSGLPLEFYVADACDHPFPDASFDRIRTERVLMYIKDLDAAFAEFRRLLKDGGKLLVVDFVWDSIVFSHSNKDLTRRITQFLCDSFPSGRIGADLFRIFKDLGFRDINVKPIGYLGQLELTKRVCGGVIQTGVEENVFTATEVEEWWAELEQDDRDGKYFMSYTGYIIVGTK